MYDITSVDSFARAKAWVRELQRQGNSNLIMALAGARNYFSGCSWQGAGGFQVDTQDTLHLFLIASRCAGNKADLEGQRAVTSEEALAYANENGLHFLETSAKTAANVNELFFEIARKLPKAEASAVHPQGGIVLSQNATQQPQERRGACC